MASELDNINNNNQPNTTIVQPKDELEKEQERDVLEGGLMTLLFPGYGGARSRIVIRVIVFFALIILGIWVYRRYIKKPTSIQ